MGEVAIAATGPVSLGAGRALARAGGNAVDAAVAAALAAMATEPGIVSLGGGAFVSVWAPGEDPVVVDGNVEMPGRGLPPEAFGRGVRQVHTDYGGGVTMFVGHGSVATPGAAAACEHAVARFGRAPWAEAVAPAADACRAGYVVGGAAGRYLGFVAGSLFGPDPEAHALVTRRDGSPLRAGEVATNGALADLLDLLGREGSALLSTGEVGRAMVEDMARHEGLVTAADLTAHRPLEREPVRRTVGEWDLAVNPPPSVGGPMLAAMLGELARRGDYGWSDVLAIQTAVLRYRLAVHDVATDLDAAGHALLAAVDRHGLAGLPTSASTAHVSAVDTDGLACAVTMSAGYGAGVTVPGTGLLLNNALGEPELNRLGLHALAPGTRMASNMAPTTGRTDDGRVIAVGSPGADRITTALMQVLGQGCLHGADLQAAVDAPRLHVRFDDAGRPVVEHESDPAITAAVREAGLAATDHGSVSMYFGGVGAAYRREDGTVLAAGDPRREAAVEVVPGPAGAGG
ncbi:gamma-glutamyltransferase [Phycicoccus endophyticus]|uniref:Gamma-glutamyltransferase n=1 Tax=Phycicoccus endophyticus TaxID=1690220 RepID=A0A7G9R0P5_9MICO|nr:gamma-glutamyltransferase [Phycicoccus endophyticus]NHI19453.1 gamma-glutamyltranspeptidase [Phycicoccus endophyticus]QNN49170.1 gamma-glutamyltransferase [Phycicoccus endophyticus]